MEVAPEQDLCGCSEWLAVQTDILDRVRKIPELRSAGWPTSNPLTGRGRRAVIEIPGFVPQTETDKDIHLAAISPEYFDTFGVPILLGRKFSVGDHGSAPKVAILNQTAARFYFGNSNPIGRRVKFANYPSRDPLYEVVGVVRDMIHDNVRGPTSRFIYLPIPQHVEPINRLALAARCSSDAITFVAPVRRQIQAEHEHQRLSFPPWSAAAQRNDGQNSLAARSIP